MGFCKDGHGCASSGECGGRKSAQSALLLDAVAHLYPTRTWGVADGVAPAFTRGEIAAFGRSLSRALRAPVYLQKGDDDEPCDFLWALCVGRHPGLILIRDGKSEPVADVMREAYLRVALSQLGRFACVQEVRVRLDAKDGVYEERPRDGVFDPVLLSRFRRTIQACDEAGIRHLDMGMLDKTPPDCDAGTWPARFGEGVPTYLNYLFFPQPPTAVMTRVLPLQPADPRTRNSLHEPKSSVSDRSGAPV